MSLYEHPCLVCGQPQDDRLHGPLPRKDTVQITPRIEQHAYDPGERRKRIRRKADRIKL